MNFKKIHIGSLIKNRVVEIEVEIPRICNFLQCTVEEINNMYAEENLSTDILLRWSKLLEYDFFRIYSQHLILYSPPASDAKTKKKKSRLPRFRKNIYTQDMINYVLEQIKTGEMTRIEVIERYRIPKTTLYKWLNKYK